MNTNDIFTAAFEISVEQRAIGLGVSSWEVMDWLYGGLIEEVPVGWLSSEWLTAVLYLLRDKRTLKGGAFQKSLGVRAYNAENNVCEADKCSCLVCGRIGRKWQTDVWYMLSEKKNYIDDWKTVYIPSHHRLVVERKILAGGNHRSRGMWLCDRCVAELRAIDPASLSVVSVLLDKADEVLMKSIQRVAEYGLTYSERRALEVEREKVRSERKRAIDGALKGDAEIKFAMVDGSLVKVEGE